jgi:hypothetical protein
MIDYAEVLIVNFSNYEWSIDNNEYESIKWISKTKKPSKNELDSLWNITVSIKKKQNCKDKAKQLIASSDWSVLPDVNITNKSEFESYRTQLRNLIINPVEEPIFPIEPNPIWSK